MTGYPISRRAALITLLGAVLLATVPAAAGPRVAGEYEVKAAFLYNFAKFIEWPDRAFPAADAPFVIGVLGDDPFGPALDDLERREVHGRKVVVWRIGSVRTAPACHILFVSESERRDLEAVIRGLQSMPTLLVSDIEDFARRGGMIAFEPQGDRLTFAINPVAARKAGLKISSQLLKLARIVQE